jgi:hypothetical protein
MGPIFRKSIPQKRKRAENFRLLARFFGSHTISPSEIGIKTKFLLAILGFRFFACSLLIFIHLLFRMSETPDILQLSVQVIETLLNI